MFTKIENNSEFIKVTIEGVRDYIINGFVSEYATYSVQLRTFNNAICSIPLSIFKGGVSKDFFYEKYNDFCGDILLIFDDYIKGIDFSLFFTQPVPQHIMEYYLNDEVKLHLPEISQFIGEKTSEIIIRPFFNELIYKLVEYKIGTENYKRLQSCM